MKIALAGGTGFIGKSLSRHFTDKGDEVVLITRADIASGPEAVATKISGSGVVINLAGAPVIGRWSRSYKNLIYSSRIHTTQTLTEAINRNRQNPVFITASAVGIYQSSGIHDEFQHELASDFLAIVCRDWESEALKATAVKRLVIIRLGVVLGKGGGALSRLLLPFRLGLGGRIGSGKQGFSWIHIQDVVNAVEYIIGLDNMEGIYNFTAPDPADNNTFTETLARVLRRPALVPVPEFALKLIFGQGASTLTEGQKVVPRRLLDSGFQFEFPELQAALLNIIKR